MPQRPFLAFACAHLTDERLYAAQVAALSADYQCAVFAFRDHDSLGGMADELLANTPARFTLIGLDQSDVQCRPVIMGNRRADQAGKTAPTA